MPDGNAESDGNTRLTRAKAHRLGAVAGRARRARVQRVGEAGADSEAVMVIRVAETEIGAPVGLANRRASVGVTRLRTMA